MRDNINKVSQRGERLDSLQDKTDNLAVSAQGFRRGANRVRKQVSTYPWTHLYISTLASCTKTVRANLDVVERYEDANVHHRGDHSVAYRDYCSFR